MESKFAELKLVTIGFDSLFGLAVKVSRPRWMTLVTLGSQQMEMSPCLWYFWKFLVSNEKIASWDFWRWKNVTLTKKWHNLWLTDLEMLLGSGWDLWQYLSWEMVVLSRRRCHLDEAEGHLAMGKEREASCFHPKHILPRQPQWSPPSDQTLLITWSSSSLVTASQQVLTKLWFTASAVVSHALVCWLLPAVSSSQLVHPLSGSGRGKYSPTGFATFSEPRGLHNTRSHDPGILSLPAQTSQHHRCRCGNTQQGEKDKNMSLKNRDAQIHKYNSRSCANGDWKRRRRILPLAAQTSHR